MRQVGDFNNDAPDPNPKLADLTEDITRRLQSGESVDIEAYAISHPECAVSIRALFSTMNDLIDLGKAPRRTQTPSN